MSDVSEIPRIAEPFFLAFNAKVEIHPAMNAQDLARALPAIEQAVKKYGTAVQTLDARTEPLARAEATAAHDRVPSTWIASEPGHGAIRGMVIGRRTGPVRVRC